MRYFTTNEPGFLYWVWDDETNTMSVYDNPDFVLPNRTNETPDTLNRNAQAGIFDPENPMYAYETDSAWNRL